MVGHFLGLKLRLFGNSLRGNAARVVGVVVGLLAAAVGGLGGGAGLAFFHGHEAAFTAAPLIYLAVFLIWVIVPLITFASDETLDPTRLALLPLSERDITVGLLAASFIGAPSFATIALVIGGALGFAGTWALLPIAILGSLCQLLLCLGASRAMAAAISGLLRSRRGRDLAVLVGVLVALSAQGINLGLHALDSAAGREALHTVAQVVRWTPPGAASRAALDIADGAVVAGLAELVIALASVVLVLLWWSRSLRSALTTVDASTQSTVKRSLDAGGESRRLLGITLSARTVAVARRELRYATREPRRRAGWISTGVFGLVLPVVYVVSAQLPARVLVYWVCVTALVVGLQTLNQLGLEGSALWLQISATSSAADAREDGAGRNLAHTAFAVPVLLVTSVLLGGLTGQWSQVVGAFGLSLAFYGAALAVGSITSVLAPYSVPERSGAFGGPGPGRGCLAGLTGVLATFGSVLLCAPLVGFLVVVLVFVPVLSPVMLVLGAGYGFGLLALGRRIAADRFVTRMPELLAIVRRDSAA